MDRTVLAILARILKEEKVQRSASEILRRSFASAISFFWVHSAALCSHRGAPIYVGLYREAQRCVDV